MIVVLMGVSGSGKTTVGRLLAERLGAEFVDGDAFHSAANRQKMASGMPLTDEDRWPWLAALRTAIEAKLHSNQSAVIACSALKAAYRDILRGGTLDSASPVRFVYLKGSFELLRKRLVARANHFFDPALLQSQLQTLDEPPESEALTIGIELAPAAIVDLVMLKLAGAR